MNTVEDKPSVLLASVGDIQEAEKKVAEEDQEIRDAVHTDIIQSSLASHITGVFQDNKSARTSSGIEAKLLQSLRAYNGKYDPEDLARIEESGGSKIYMNLTPTKCRAAMSWIRDIMMPANEKAWSFEPTPLPDIPEELKAKVQEQIQQLTSQSVTKDAQGATASMQEINSTQRDIEEAIYDEIYKVARSEVKSFERVVEDDLVEGGWEDALSQFIEDFCVFQVAVMKGPIITKKARLSWEDGKPVPKEDFIYLNKRVSPLDIYPSASATSICDGDLCEHVRYTRSDLYNLIGIEGYKEYEIRKLLDSGNPNGLYFWLDNNIESEKTIEEFRGDTYRANKGIYHGIHYFGSASYRDLKDWGIDEAILGYDEDREFQVEAILVGNSVIKCEINDDPLLRRPYYKASFQNIPGSWWGRSLPELMRDIQRVCNATARALANNMGIASGPQIEVYIDRLAADEEIDSINPFKIWQVTSDPTGAGGRAVTFWQPSSNAQELLAVYREFEVKADDATGIPRYAYGNERVGGAAQTASGLSMLLESASKGIKDAVRHIDAGLIKPRVEYQFYWNMITTSNSSFSGDVIVVPKGTKALTMKGAQEMRRNEFLQLISNPTVFNIVGEEGLAEILREMSKSLGLGENIVPSRIEIKKRLEEQKAQQQQMVQAEQQHKQGQTSAGIQQVQMQVQQAEAASQRSAQLKAAEISQKAKDSAMKNSLKAEELNLRREESATNATTKLTAQQMKDAQKDRDTNKNIALSIKSGYKDKNNQQ